MTPFSMSAWFCPGQCDSYLNGLSRQSSERGRGRIYVLRERGRDHKILIVIQIPPWFYGFMAVNPPCMPKGTVIYFAIVFKYMNTYTFHNHSIYHACMVTQQKTTVEPRLSGTQLSSLENLSSWIIEFRIYNRV